MQILGIETSCDETAAAVVKDGTSIVSNVVASSQEMHIKTGGIIPERAAREQVKCMMPVIEEAIHDVPLDLIDAIAVTYGPGLIGSLLVGTETAKTLAYVWKKPIVPINHLIGHIYANFVHEIRNSKLETRNNEVVFPAMVLIVSGGHTELLLMKGHGDFTFIGRTRDDAAGEAFDKIARILGLGYPGGPAISKAAENYKQQVKSQKSKVKNTNQKSKIKLPRPMIDSGDFDFSFSGLKTAVLHLCQKHTITPDSTQNPGKIDIDSGSIPIKSESSGMTAEMLAYETQEAITDVLVKKTVEAVKKYKVRSILLAGGVTANLRLREKMIEAVNKINSPDSGFLRQAQDKLIGMTLSIPPVNLCTDNAVGIASAAFFNYKPVDFRGIIVDPGLEI